MVAKILSQPIHPICIAMLTHKKGHARATARNKWQEDVFVPKNINRWSRESIGRHIGIVHVIGDASIEGSDHSFDQET